MIQKHLSNPLDCLIEWCEKNAEIKEKYPLIINNAKDELKRLRMSTEPKESFCNKSKKIDEFFKLDLNRPLQDLKNKAKEIHNQTDLRYGQAIMNLLNQTRPEIYQKINGTELDCFYNDEKVETLLEYLEKIMQQ
jgi:hypothetical protein